VLPRASSLPARQIISHICTAAKVRIRILGGDLREPDLRLEIASSLHSIHRMQANVKGSSCKGRNPARPQIREEARQKSHNENGYDLRRLFAFPQALPLSCGCAGYLTIPR
jgi:hypothetical protein